MITQIDESISAVASAAGNAARGIIRLSGPRIDKSLARCFVPRNTEIDLARVARPIFIPGRMRVAPPIRELEVDLIYWPNSSSYTRQRSAEIHVVGSPPVLESVMAALRQAGTRQANPGEFTMRAFLAGRLDLPRAEAVLGVIDARSEQEMNIALQQMAGGISQPLQQLREHLLELVAQIEAGLDFVEEDIEFISGEETISRLGDCLSKVDEILRQICGRQLDQKLLRVVLYGLPNVGKSCLLNSLTERPKSIVSSTPGTTRDFVVGRLELGGLNVELIDTAGIDLEASSHVAGSSVESTVAQSMLQVTRRELAAADLTVLCLDGSRPLTRWELDELQGRASNRIAVRTKSDLPTVWNRQDLCLSVSSYEMRGIDELRAEITQRLSSPEQEQEIGSVVPCTAERVVASVERAREDLQVACQAVLEQTGDEVVAAQIRSCLDELAVVTGRVYTDDILDRIFSRFCIGK